MAVRTALQKDNPWWEDAQRIGDDTHIRAWSQSHLHWSPPIMSEFDYGRAGSTSDWMDRLGFLLAARIIHERRSARPLAVSS